MEIVGIINKLTNTSEFKELQILGKTIHDTQRQFDLLSAFEDIIDEMAWSRIFAFILDSSQRHGLSQRFLRLLLERNSHLTSFKNHLPSEKESESISLLEWRTEKDRRIDILIKIIDKLGNTRAVIGIENKVDSGEQTNQIRDYQNSLKSAFPAIPKIIIFLTPDGRTATTCNYLQECLCHSISYKELSLICDEIIPSITGQANLFLSIIRTQINNITNKENMDIDAIQLIKKLYKNPEYRHALKLISQYSPCTRHIFDSISEQLDKSISLPFSIKKRSIDYYPKTNSNPHEFKFFIDELMELTESKGLYPCYMLHCEKSNPDIGDIFTLRLVIWNNFFKGINSAERQQLRETLQNAFMFSNSLGTNKNWSQWTCIWTGNSYRIHDLGEDDIDGLYSLLLNGIKETYIEYKKGLNQLSRITS